MTDDDKLICWQVVAVYHVFAIAVLLTLLL
jgi:hypothetical protein